MELKRFILEQDWTFVTRNSVDFRRPANQPGSKGQYADVPLHAGLVCINGPDSMSAENEVELFGIVLNELGSSQMVNQVIEIMLAETEAGYELVRYELPMLVRQSVCRLTEGGGTRAVGAPRKIVFDSLSLLSLRSVHA